ncbi:uncharacterized protein, partial [Halyomorpha halys]|uniref:uncharacterized protein n=1 Tax=Halyomorpha halys TaxID=286706 RepID=UPI0006D4EBE6
MAFAAARMILKDKRRKSSKEDFARSKSKARSASTSSFRSLSQARNKPADGHVNQKCAPKGSTTPVKKPPTAQKGSVKTPAPKAQQQAVAKPPPPAPIKKDNKKKRHQQHDLIVTINL